MGCPRCEELFRLAEEAIEVHAQVNAQLAIAELAGSRVKAKRLRNLAKTTDQNREWAAAAYRSHSGSHTPVSKMKRAGSG
ncbi:MAG TPA: hypothetical protein VG096_17540 [Bryobacteraceae bacterium]|jgi:hypothetical protein|nr:hypothetical protein [Bryobacteraceae bacterium]